MLKEIDSEGHKLAYNLFNEIESRFCEYGNHISTKDENGKKAQEEIKGFVVVGAEFANCLVIRGKQI